MPDPTYSVAVELVSGSFTEVGSDCLRFTIAREAGGVVHGLPVGRADLILDNFDARYSPDNPGGPYAGLLKPNKALRIQATHSGSTYNLFRGLIDRYSPEPELERRVTHVQASDRLKDLMRRRIDSDIAIDTNPGSLAWDVLSRAGVAVADRDVDTLPELSTIPFAWFRDAPALQAMEQILRFGYYSLYAAPNGRVTVKGRYWGPGDAIGTVVASYVNDFFALDYALSDDAVVNFARVQGTPRRISTSVQTVAWLQERPFIPASSGIGFTLAYVDPDSNERETPARSISVTNSADYLTNTNSGGTGVDRTAQASAQLTVSAVSAVCSIFNGSADPVYLTKFQLRGFSIQRQPEIVAIAQDNSSQTVYGRRDFTLASDFIGTFDPYAQSYADFLIRDRKEPLADIGFTLKNVFPDVLGRELGDIVHLVESNTAVGSRFAIRSIEHDVTLARGLEHSVRYGVVFWIDREYLVLDNDPNGRLDSRRAAF